LRVFAPVVFVAIATRIVGVSRVSRAAPEESLGTPLGTSLRAGEQVWSFLVSVAVAEDGVVYTTGSQHPEREDSQNVETVSGDGKEWVCDASRRILNGHVDAAHETARRTRIRTTAMDGGRGAPRLEMRYGSCVTACAKRLSYDRPNHVLLLKGSVR
jgi:hypothetical protein